MTAVAGWQPSDGPNCDKCEPIGVFGCVPADDPRYFGGHVDARGVRHDPLMHSCNPPDEAYREERRTRGTNPH